MDVIKYNFPQLTEHLPDIGNDIIGYATLRPKIHISHNGMSYVDNSDPVILEIVGLAYNQNCDKIYISNEYWRGTTLRKIVSEKEIIIFIENKG
jgi:hypothetical protein